MKGHTSPEDAAAIHGLRADDDRSAQLDELVVVVTNAISAP